MPLKILIAEDSATHRLLYETTMARWGHAADIVANGEEALAFFRKNSYDLVFLDLNMPVVGGLTAAREMRKHDKNDTPIYAISGFPPEGMAARFEEIGIRRCLGKPLLREDLTNILAECGLQDKPQHHDAPHQPLHIPEKLMKTYADELRSRGRACEKFFQEQDKKSLRREGHTIRALAQMLHMQALEAAALALEQPELSEEQVHAAVEACEKVAAYIEKNLMTSSSSGLVSGAVSTD